MSTRASKWFSDILLSASASCDSEEGRRSNGGRAGPGKALTLQAEIWSSVDSEEFLLSWRITVYHLGVVCLNAVSAEECVNETNQDKDALGSRVFKC